MTLEQYTERLQMRLESRRKGQARSFLQVLNDRARALGDTPKAIADRVRHDLGRMVRRVG